jgi:hypothetical protein
VQDHPHQGHAQAPPRREEVDEVDRPHVRDAGPVEPDGEEEEPEAAADGGGEQGAPAGSFLGGTGHGRVSLADIASLGTEPTDIAPPPPNFQFDWSV